MELQAQLKEQLTKLEGNLVDRLSKLQEVQDGKFKEHEGSQAELEKKYSDLAVQAQEAIQNWIKYKKLLHALKQKQMTN